MKPDRSPVNSRRIEKISKNRKTDPVENVQGRKVACFARRTTLARGDSRDAGSTVRKNCPNGFEVN